MGLVLLDLAPRNFILIWNGVKCKENLELNDANAYRVPKWRIRYMATFTGRSNVSLPFAKRFLVWVLGRLVRKILIF